MPRLASPARQGTRSVKLYDRKTPITAADLLNDRVIPFFDEHDIALSRILTDRGTEYWGCTKWTPQGVNPERHEYELYLAVEDIDHNRTCPKGTPGVKTKSPQTKGICERFHKTILEEFYRVAFRKCPPGDAKRQDLPEPGRAAGRSRCMECEYNPAS
jgi:hypothetical protein